MALNQDQKQIIYILAGITIITPILAIIGLGLLSTIDNQIKIDPQGAIQNQFRPQNTAIFHPQEVGEVSINIEIADTPQEQAYGLMNRTNLPQDSGMLFIFPDSQFRSFWMKDTYISLDIIFIDEQKRIINIRKNATPLQTSPTYTSTKPSMYVIEVNAGFSDKHNLQAGDLVSF